MAQHSFLFELTQVERQAPDEIIRALRSVQGTIDTVCRSQRVFPCDRAECEETDEARS